MQRHPFAAGAECSSGWIPYSVAVAIEGAAVVEGELVVVQGPRPAAVALAGWQG